MCKFDDDSNCAWLWYGMVWRKFLCGMKKQKSFEGDDR